MEERLLEAPCGFIALDPNSCIIETNNTFLKEMGYQQSEVVGKHVESFLKPGARMVFHSYFYPNISLYGEVSEFVIKIRNQAGEEVPFILNALRHGRKGQDIIDCILLPMKRRLNYEQELRQTKVQMEEAYRELEQIYQEIQVKQSELAELNSHLVALTNTDTLTGIPNRKYFQEKLEEQVDLYWSAGLEFSLLMLDIDFFKMVNDLYGHQIGDTVLVKVANILKEYAEGEYIVTRYGGEEFIVLLPGADEEESSRVAVKLNQLVEDSDWEETGSLSVSVGVATFTKEDNEISILRKADQALYYSKENGRNRATHFSQLVN